MSNVITQAVEALRARLPDGFDGSIKFVIIDEGAIILDSEGVRAGDEETDCTMRADVDTFRGILSGDVNPTAAFMMGRLKVEGDMGAAMRLGSALS